MVPASSHATKFYLDPAEGILAADVDGKVLVDCSTIDVASFNAVWSRAAGYQSGTHFYDAPISGGSLGAEARKSTFMVGMSNQEPPWKSIHGLL